MLCRFTPPAAVRLWTARALVVLAVLAVPGSALAAREVPVGLANTNDQNLRDSRWWEAAYASRYRIMTSTDGTNYTQAADVAGKHGWQTTAFTARDARYVRVVGVTRATGYGFS